MDSKALRVGWGLLVFWVVITLIIANSYRAIDTANTQIYTLSSNIQEIRHSFSFDAPYRVHMSDSQSLNLQHMYALRLQLGKYNHNRWLWPDISQLLFLTDRFIEQSQIYLNNNLQLLSLVKQIAIIRERYKNQPTEELYFHLSTDVLEAIFGDSALRPQAYRDLDNVYAQSNQLSIKQRQDLQQVLAQVSSVLNNYAQGRYIVDELKSHAVGEQIDIANDKFRQVLLYHLVFATLLTLIVLISFIALLRFGQASQHALAGDDVKRKSGDDKTAKEKRKSQHSTSIEMQSKPKVEPKHSAIASQVAVPTDKNPPFNSDAGAQIEIEFKKMLESFNHDLDSVCMLLEVFIADHCEDVETIIQLLETSIEEAQRKAHSLKGVGGNLSALPLSQAAGKVEMAIKTDGAVDSHSLSELKQHLDGAIKEAKAFLQHNNR